MSARGLVFLLPSSFFLLYYQIPTSVGNIFKFLNQSLEELPTLFQSLSPEEAQNFVALLNRSLQEKPSFSAKEDRKVKRVLVSQLKSERVEKAEDLADTIVDMRIYNNTNFIK